MDTLRLDETRERIEQISDGVGRVRFNDYWGQGRKVVLQPQAFLVHLEDEGSTLKTHMHDVDQFQVAVAGDGRIGAKRWKPVSVHYADAFTLYGPIVRGGPGLSFHTLRMLHGGGNWRMPEARALMPGGKPGRNVTADVDPDAALPPAGVAGREHLVEPLADGLAIARIRLGAGARTEGYAPAGGQYMLVCAGSLLHDDGRELPPQSLLLLRAGEAAPVLQAGPEGALVVVMQFPRPSQRKGSDPAALADRPIDYVSASSRHRPA